MLRNIGCYYWMGKIRGNEMKPTVRDIAKKAEVSIASVSLVLNNKPSRITEKTKQRIRKAAEELGYNFEEKNQQDVRGKDRSAAVMIGVIRSRYGNAFLDACQKGIDQYASIYGYRTITCVADDSTDNALDEIRTLDRLGVEGLIVIPPVDMNSQNNNERIGEALRSAERPFLLLHQAVHRVYCDFVTADNKSGGYMATEHLICCGHKKIGMIVGAREVYTCRKRIEGYKEALAFYGIPINEDYIFEGNYTRETGYDGMKYLQEEGVSAVFAHDDEIALGVYQFAKEKQLAVGKDISVVGFGDSFAADLLTPPLTTVSQPGELMGKKACEIIINRITGRDKEPIRNTYFSPVLIERGSVEKL